MKRLIVSFPDELLKRLKHYCVDHEIKLADIIRQLVQEFLDREEKKKK
jgi:metal-responsive CopG/Arc/MetJ family transcriptional regulator